MSPVLAEAPPDLVINHIAEPSASGEQVCELEREASRLVEGFAPVGRHWSHC